MPATEREAAESDVFSARLLGATTACREGDWAGVAGSNGVMVKRARRGMAPIIIGYAVLAVGVVLALELFF